MQESLLSHTATENLANDAYTSQQSDACASRPWGETDAERLHRLHNCSPISMLRPLKRCFLPRYTPTQLLEFFNRPAGPRITDALYTIRPARFSDVPSYVMLPARADWHMPVMRIFHPPKKQFPQDYLRAYWEGNLLWMCKPGALTYVAVRQHQSGVAGRGAEEDEVIGMIRFSRHGDGQKGAPRQHGWVGFVVDWLMTAWMRIVRSSWVKPLRSKKLSTEAEKNAVQLTIEKFGVFEKRYWERVDLKERWYVESLCVKDEWRGRGVGKALMELVTRRCVEEKLPLTLSATEDGAHLYRKMGFEKLDEIRLPGGGENSTFQFMVWDPRKRD